MNLNRYLVPALALCLAAMAPGAAKALGMPGQGQAYGSQGQDRGWDAPPPEFRAAQSRGFHDGMEGARRDFDNHRTPDPNNRDEYRHPNVPPGDREAYREGFRRGYERAVNHLMGGPMQPVAAPPHPPQMREPEPGRPMMGPDPGAGIRHQGFADGVEGALRDLDNHRNPDPNNRDEFRNPNVPPEFREPYRAGFRAGYGRASSEIYDYRGTGPGADFWHKGFRDGMEGALRDLDNHRSPNPNNRDEYRSPSVPGEMWAPYQEGFRHGYNVGIGELTGDRR